MERPNSNKPRGIYILPNLFTIGSIFAGFFSMAAALKGNFENAAVAIFVAMIMDSLDGRVARLTNTMTSFGAEFDSMADMVSFAVAPAFLAYSWGLYNLGKFGWISAFIYTVAVALRLARFNTQLGKMGKRYFQGIPCPAAAAVVCSLIWVCLDLDWNTKLIDLIVAVVTVLVGILMVSNIRYRSFKDIDLKSHVPFVVILAIVVIVVLITFDPSKILFAIFIGYAISGPIATIWALNQKKRLHHDFIKLRHEQKKS
jgi:CDP-diacylglycerol---serine O-phosphatidyltransferase